MKEQCDICGEIKAVHMKDEEGNSICPDCYNIVQSLESPACVYAIQRIDTKKVYIGSTVDLINRYGSTEKPHISGIRNPILHDEIKSMGWEGNFELIILETVDKTSPDYSKAKLLQAESKWLNEYGGCESDKTYNQRDSIITDKIPKKRKIKPNKQINIQVSRDTHRKLNKVGRRNETFDQIVNRAIIALNNEERYGEYYFPYRQEGQIDLQYGKVLFPKCGNKATLKIGDLIEAVRASAEDAGIDLQIIGEYNSPE